MSRTAIITPNYLVRGDVITASDVSGLIREPVAVLFVTYREAGGAGMGEYPETRTIVLSDGRLLQYDAWVSNPKLPQHVTISGKATFAKDGRLVLFDKG